MKSLLRLSLISSFALTLQAPAAHAWGEHGHHMICELATRLVKSPELSRFLMARGDIMGHVCNIPDIYWRDLGPNAAIGDAAHFMNPETTNLAIAQIPPKFSLYMAADKNAEDTNVNQKADRVGSMWWRAQQFYNRAVQSGQQAARATLPAGRQDEQNRNLPFNAGVREFQTNLGLMGHFVGDASQPLHNTTDYDAKDEGHGGLHGFYEGTCVSFYDLSLATQVETQARRMVPPGMNETALSATRVVSLQSIAEKPQMILLDKLAAPPVPNSYGKRLSPDVACPAFRGLIVTELARSAVTLAAMWDKAFVEAGQPKLSAYRSYEYPLAPAFVPPDYISIIP